MQTKILSILTPRNLSLVVLGITCIAGSLLLGIRSAGEVHTFGPSAVLGANRTEAQQASVLVPILTGDIDGDGRVTLQDAITLLEVLRGTAKVPPETLLMDPDGSGAFTLDDALWILRSLSTTQP